MLIEKLFLAEFNDSAEDHFSDKFNLITSNNKNSVGKSTYCRLIFYALGYAIPSTEGINFEKVITKITMKNGNKSYDVERRNKLLYVRESVSLMERHYNLPEDHPSFLSYIFETDNLRIVNNLLGLMYIDQEKGWTLFNRGKVIGNNRFSIDELVGALNGVNCEDLYNELDYVENEIDKCRALKSIDSIKREYYENNNNLEIITLGEDLKMKIASLQLSIQSLKDQIKEINRVINQDKNFFDYIESMGIFVKFNDTLVQVTRDNIENSINIEFLIAQKANLNNQLAKLEKEKSRLSQEYNVVLEGTNLFNENLVLETEKEINRVLSTINVNVDSLEEVLNNAKSNRAYLKSQIKERIRLNNDYIIRIYELFRNYAEELGVNSYISDKKDYIFTDDLKGKTGAIFQKLIIAFKIATIKVVESVINTNLFLVVDSPKSKELDDENTKLIMSFLKKELSDNQVIMASIFNEKELFISFENTILFGDKAIESRYLN